MILSPHDRPRVNQEAPHSYSVEQIDLKVCLLRLCLEVYHIHGSLAPLSPWRGGARLPFHIISNMDMIDLKTCDLLICKVVPWAPYMGKA